MKHIVGVNSEGEAVDTGVLEEVGVAFDPTSQHFDLSKDEKRRTTALLMAIQAYSHLIIKDAEYLREMKREERDGGPKIQPGTISAMVEAAIEFDLFIQGGFEKVAEEEDPTIETPEAE